MAFKFNNPDPTNSPSGYDHTKSYRLDNDIPWIQPNSGHSSGQITSHPTPLTVNGRALEDLWINNQPTTNTTTGSPFYGAEHCIVAGEHYIYYGCPYIDGPGSGDVAGCVVVTDYKGNLVKSFTGGTNGNPLLGVAGESFGTGIGYTNGRLFVGAPGSGLIGTKKGAVYMFEHRGDQRDLYHTNTATYSNSYILQPIISNSTVPGLDVYNDSFGARIAANDGMVAIGCGRRKVTNYATSTVASSYGHVWVFDINGNHLFTCVHTGEGPNEGANEGNAMRGVSSIAIGNGIIAVGSVESPNNATNTYRGNVHVFDYQGKLLTIIEDDDASNTGDNFFGWSVAVGNGRLAIGTPYMANGGLSNAGKVQVFDLNFNKIGEVVGDGANANVGKNICIGNGKIFYNDNWNGFSPVNEGGVWMRNAYDFGSPGTKIQTDNTTLFINSGSATNFGDFGLACYHQYLVGSFGNGATVLRLDYGNTSAGVGDNSPRNSSGLNVGHALLSTGALAEERGIAWQVSALDTRERPRHGIYRSINPGIINSALGNYSMPGTSTSNYLSRVYYTTSTVGAGPLLRLYKGGIWELWNGNGTLTYPLNSAIIANAGLQDAPRGRWSKSIPGYPSTTTGFYARNVLQAGSADTTNYVYKKNFNTWYQLPDESGTSSPNDVAWKKNDPGYWLGRIEISTYAGTGGIVATGYVRCERIENTPGPTLSGVANGPLRSFGLTAGTDIVIGWEFRNDGTIYEVGGAYGTQDRGDWYVGGTPGDHWIRFTQNSSDPLGTDAPDASYSDSSGTWHQVGGTSGSTRRIRWNPPANSFAGGSMKVEISTSSSGSPIVATGYYGIEVESGQ